MRTLATSITFILLCAAALAQDPPAKTKRILILGDSWATSISAENPDHFPAPDVFDDTLAENGFTTIETQGAKTAWAGRKASDWAKPENLAIITSELQDHSTLDIIHLIIGGNDYLNAVHQENFPKDSPEARDRIWTSVARDIQSIVEHCLAVRPDIRVLIADYDYLDAQAAEEFWKQPFHGATPEQLNTWFRELGEHKRAIAQNTDRCEYLDNWGTLQYWFGDPPQAVPLPGGDITKPMPPGISPDGIHPNEAAHQKLLQNAIDQHYTHWLRE